MTASTFSSDTAEDFAALMEEAPGGENHGRERKVLATDDLGAVGRVYNDLGRPKETDFLATGGWGIERGTSHRGVLHPQEYVDQDELLVAVERELGFTINEVKAVYRQGRKSAEQGELRARIDARLLALSRAQANMLALARIFGWAITPGNTDGGADCRTMDRALDRARTAEAV